MDIITLDFETYYADDYTLSKLTTEAYVRDPRFETILCGFQVNHERPYWVPRGELPAALRDLREIQHFSFGEDRYVVKMQDGREYQDNDLDRMLSVIRDELTAHNTTVILKGVGQPMHPHVEYPFVKGKPHMLVRPVVWTAAIPMPDLDMFLQQIEQAITYFNLTGRFVPPMKKDNL